MEKSQRELRKYTHQFTINWMKTLINQAKDSIRLKDILDKHESVQKIYQDYPDIIKDIYKKFNQHNMCPHACRDYWNTTCWFGETGKYCAPEVCIYHFHNYINN